MIGDLQLIQVDCRGWIGESMIVVGPTGRVVLIDTGSAFHAKKIAAEIEARTGGKTVDAVFLTHYHRDHIAGLAGLVAAGIQVGEVVDRGDVDLASAHRHALRSARSTDLPHLSLCTKDDCTLPFALDLGEGASLTVFAADGQILGARLPDPLRANRGGENARSLVGVIRWGDFAYVFSGDLSGGGDGTPDVERFYASRIPGSLVPENGVELLHLGHHGLATSTYQAWVDRLLPPGGDRGGITGTNATYFDAPARGVEARLRPRVGAGAIWVPEVGALHGADPLVEIAHGAVVVRVEDGGARWSVTEGTQVDRFASIPDGG